jgi:hypothetical protein
VDDRESGPDLRIDPTFSGNPLMNPPRVVKTEAAAEGAALRPAPRAASAAGFGSASAVIDLISSDSDSDAEAPAAGSGKRPLAGGTGGSAEKRARVSAVVAATAEDVPPGFLEPIPPPPPARCATKQFWKAGDYDGKLLGDGALLTSGTLTTFVGGFSLDRHAIQCPQIYTNYCTLLFGFLWAMTENKGLDLSAFWTMQNDNGIALISWFPSWNAQKLVD